VGNCQVNTISIQPGIPNLWQTVRRQEPENADSSIGTVFGSLCGVLIRGLIQTCILFDDTLSACWIKIIIGVLLFGFIGLQPMLMLFSAHRRANKPSPLTRKARPPGSVTDNPDGLRQLALSQANLSGADLAILRTWHSSQNQF
jgi:hypothetical protein